MTIALSRLLSTDSDVVGEMGDILFPVSHKLPLGLATVQWNLKVNDT
jgi:hypothetical protein